MTNTVTKTDIFNFALDHVGGLNVVAWDDQNNPNAQLCRRYFDHCVRAEFDKYEWMFAYKVIHANPVDFEQHPELRIDNYFAYFLPADFSRLSQYFFTEHYPFRKNQYDIGHNYFITRDCLYTRFPLFEIPYISNAIPIDDWNPLFCDVVAAALAKRIARKIMGADADVEYLEQVYRRTVSDARRQQVLQMEPSGTGITDTQEARVMYYGSIG